MRSPPEPIENEKILTLRGALPLIVGLGLLITLLLIWQLRIAADAPGDTLHGARPAESYGFDLETCLIPPEELVGTMARKGDIPALRSPRTISAGEADSAGRLEGTFKLMPGDRVVGVEIGGEARAYPLWILTAHEASNDDVGSTPIAVTYSPLCDSAAVFDRRVDNETLTLAASGMVYNSNTLLYDPREGGATESLWCQLQARAVAGPAAKRGAKLNVLPAYLVKWSEWRTKFPQTTVILPDPGRRKHYRPNAFAVYFNDPRLRYPVNPRPSEAHPLKTPMVAVLEGGTWQVRPAAEFQPLRDVQDRPAIYAFWFAWNSTHE